MISATSPMLSLNFVSPSINSLVIVLFAEAYSADPMEARKLHILGQGQMSTVLRKSNDLIPRSTYNIF